MKLIFVLFFFSLSSCSLNKDSKFWTEDVIKNQDDKKKFAEIFKKSDDITTMTLEEYKIYIDDYTKNSKYPDISK